MSVILRDQVTTGNALPLMEAFYTLQGEGYHKGSAAYFIRIGGCDVGCHWCDVKESWDADKHPPTRIEEIVSGAKKYSDTIVITGGEPLMWNMEPLTAALQAKNMKIHIETSGAYSITGHWDWFCEKPALSLQGHTKCVRSICTLDDGRVTKAQDCVNGSAGRSR